MKIYTIGHVSPDLDAIAAAVEYAEFLTKSKRYEGAKIEALRAGGANNETKYIFEKAGVELPEHIENIVIEPTDAFVLVDHNEESQRHPKVVSEQVIEIIDHHKVNISFTSPIRLDAKPLGSTSSLVYEHFEMYGITPSKETSFLMIAAILSDTQGLKASTTTVYDSKISNEISTKLGEDLEKLTFEIFRAKSDITGLSTREIALKDYKIFDFNGKKVLINQVETVEPEKIIEIKDELLNVMRDLKKEMDVNQIYTAITDILKINSQMIYIDDEEKAIVEKAFMTQGNNNIADIGPRMSRKKDIAPEIEKALN